MPPDSAQGRNRVLAHGTILLVRRWHLLWRRIQVLDHRYLGGHRGWVRMHCPAGRGFQSDATSVPDVTGPGGCSAAINIADCDARPGCHPVFVDQMVVRLRRAGMLRHYQRCAEGKKAKCTPPAGIGCAIHSRAAKALMSSGTRTSVTKDVFDRPIALSSHALDRRDCAAAGLARGIRDCRSERRARDRDSRPRARRREA